MRELAGPDSPAQLLRLGCVVEQLRHLGCEARLEARLPLDVSGFGHAHVAGPAEKL